jgi:hypothetical protein
VAGRKCGQLPFDADEATRDSQSLLPSARSETPTAPSPSADGRAILSSRKPEVNNAHRPRLVLAESAHPEAPAWLDDAPPWGESSRRPISTSASPFIDDARELADQAETSPPVSMLVDGLLMASCTWLLHGHFRSLKTWCVLELLIAGATGTPAFGLLSVPDRFRSLLITNEDGAGRLGERLAALCRGRGMTLEPGAIGVSAHHGVWLAVDTSAMLRSAFPRLSTWQCGTR